MSGVQSVCSVSPIAVKVITAFSGQLLNINPKHCVICSGFFGALWLNRDTVCRVMRVQEKYVYRLGVLRDKCCYFLSLHVM